MPGGRTASTQAVGQRRVMTTNGSSQTAAFIGVDVGGTHTDVSVFLGDRVERGKALTTYDDFSRGVLEAVEVAAREFDMDLGELLGRTQLFINGTTVVTNAITTLRGSNVGVLATRGFKDVFRLAGGARTTEIDDHLQVNVPDLVDRRAIREIDERVDWSGTVLVPSTSTRSAPRRDGSSRSSASTRSRSASSGATPTASTSWPPRRRSRSCTRTCSSRRRTGCSRWRARRAGSPPRCSTPTCRTRPTSSSPR